MIPRSIFFLTLTISQPTIIWSMESTDHQSTRERISQLQQLLLDVDKEIETIPPEFLAKEKIFLLGKTGSGKSTLTHYLMGDSLFVDELEHLDTNDRIKPPKIGHNESETTFPSFYHLTPTMVLVDFPGLCDIRHSETEEESAYKNTYNRIKHAYLTYKLFSGKIKILCVAEESDFFAGRGNGFLENLEHLTKLLPVEQLMGSTALVVSKQKNYTHMTLKRKINLSHGPVKKLLLHLADDNHLDARVLLFPAPTPNSMEYEIPENQEYIIDKITDLNSMQDPKLLPLELPARENIFILNLSKKLNDEISESMQNLMSEVVQSCKNMTINWSIKGALVELKNTVQAIENILRCLEMNTTENFEKILDILNFFPNNEVYTITECVQKINFLKILSPHAAFEEKTCVSFIQSALTKINKNINTEAHYLGDLITDQLSRTINPRIMRLCLQVINSPLEAEAKIEKLNEDLNIVSNALHYLIHCNIESMEKFAYLFCKFFDEPDDDALINPMEVLNHFRTINHHMNYPTQNWEDSLNNSREFIQSLIKNQETLLQEAKIKAAQEETARIEREEYERRLEEQWIAQEEAARLEREEYERQLEEHRMAELEAQYQTEIQNLNLWYEAEIAAANKMATVERILMKKTGAKITKAEYDLLDGHARERVWSKKGGYYVYYKGHKIRKK